MKIVYFILFISLNINAQFINEEDDVNVAFICDYTFPVFPSCETYKSRDSIDNCARKKIQEHIKFNLIYPKEARKNKIEGKVIVNFIVDKNGFVKVKYTRSPHPILEKEAIRIIELLPKMIPSKQRNKPVDMSLIIPLTFKL